MLKLIKEIGMKYPTVNSKKMFRYGVFECPICKKHYETMYQTAKKAKSCRSCASAAVPHPIKHGESHTPLWNVFKNIKSRCYNKSTDKYQYYGGRGITVCDEWLEDNTSFFKWAKANGYKEGLQIDRIDNSKGYTPENCRWVTRDVQMANQRLRRTNKSGFIGINWSKEVSSWRVRITVKGETIPLGFYKSLEDAVAVRRKYIEDNNLPHHV